MSTALHYCRAFALHAPRILTTTESFKPATHLAILYADRRDRRKSPGVPGAAIAIFADRRYLACQISAIKFAKCARSRDFLRLLLRIASKANPSGWAFLHWRFFYNFIFHVSFQNCHIAAIGEKNRQVCPHQSVADFRWRSNSPRSAYKIARCVAGFSDDGGYGKVNVENAIGLITKTTTVHVHYTFWYISLPSLHD